MNLDGAAQAFREFVAIVSALRAPGTGCPWDLEQDHQSLRPYLLEEANEVLDAIDRGDDGSLQEELGDLLLQVVLHAQLAADRKAFSITEVVQGITAKMVRRHPHVFGKTRVKGVDEVWANWEKIKHAEKKGTRHERASAFDGIPKHLPALLRAEKLVKKARKIFADNQLTNGQKSKRRRSKAALAKELFELAERAQRQGWSAEELLSDEVKRRESLFRYRERT